MSRKKSNKAFYVVAIAAVGVGVGAYLLLRKKHNPTQPPAPPTEAERQTAIARMREADIAIHTGNFPQAQPPIRMARPGAKIPGGSKLGAIERPLIILR